jgi:hypothetical protein
MTDILFLDLHLRSSLVGHFDAEFVGQGAVSNPEVCVWAGAVVVQIGDVKRFGVQDADVSGTQTVRQALELGQHPRLGHVQVRWDEHISEINLRGRKILIK